MKACGISLFSRVQLELESDSISTRVRVCVCVSVCLSVCPHRVFFAYKSPTDDWILMVFRYMIDINETKKLTEGQGHKVKGQGQICNFTKKLFLL